MSDVKYTTDLANVDWDELKLILAADRFDNGRTSKQLRDSFGNSFASVVAFRDDRIVGTARVLSDGVCNAYIVDVWTQSEHRRRRIGRQMVEIILSKLDGQHVYLFTDDVVGFYKKLGFEEQPVGLGKVVGVWLKQGTTGS